MSSILDAYGLAVLTMTEQEIANRVEFLLHNHGFAFENPDNVSVELLFYFVVT